MVKLCFIQYLNGILMTLKLIYQIKATQGITGLNCIIAHIKWMVSHLDVGLSFPKSVLCPSAHGVLIHFSTYMSWVKNDVNQFGLYLFSFSQNISLFYPPIHITFSMNLRLHHSVRKDQQQIALAEFYNGPGPITLSSLRDYNISITTALVQFLFLIACVNNLR